MTALVGLIMVAVWISALVDAILAPEDKVQRLPRVAWILLIVFLTVIGAILWFAFGRERGGGIRPMRRPRAEPERRAAPSSSTAPSDRRGADPRSTEQQLADLDREIEYYRRLQASPPEEPDRSGGPTHSDGRTAEER